MRDTTRDLLSRIETMEHALGRLKTLATSPTVASDAAPSSADESGSQPSASRRDVLRYGAVALGAAAAAGMAASPVEAADGGPVVIGSFNTGTAPTDLFSSGPYGFRAASTATNSYGLMGSGNLVGIYGETVSRAAEGAGVRGVTLVSTSQAPGMAGYSQSLNAPGVYGYNKTGGNAIRAEVPAVATSNAIAMYALNYSTYTGGGPGAGGFAIYGLSAKGHGLVGATAAAGAAAVVGATNGVAGAYAAAFYGPVIVGGNFTVVGGAKSAAVPHPDGSHRRLYCMESPESWFEDFGNGQLECGRAEIAIDPDFAALVAPRRVPGVSHAYDQHNDLCVTDRTPSGFQVEARDATTHGAFGWRVVAKRKDITGDRLETVTIPPEPTLPPVPDTPSPTPPTPPHQRDRRSGSQDDYRGL